MTEGAQRSASPEVPWAQETSGQPPRGARTAGGAGWDPFTGAGAGFPPGGGGARSSNLRGEDVNVTATISLEDAHKGGSVPLRMPTGKVLNVKLPEKVEDGQQIRLKGQGMPAPHGGPPGDVLITITVAPHPLFKVEEKNLRLELPVTL